MYEQCSFHIADTMPSSVKVGVRPISATSREYSSGFSPCATASVSSTFGSVSVKGLRSFSLKGDARPFSLEPRRPQVARALRSLSRTFTLALIADEQSAGVVANARLVAPPRHVTCRKPVTVGISNFQTSSSWLASIVIDSSIPRNFIPSGERVSRHSFPNKSLNIDVIMERLKPFSSPSRDP